MARDFFEENERILNRGANSNNRNNTRSSTTRKTASKPVRKSSKKVRIAKADLVKFGAMFFVSGAIVGSFLTHFYGKYGVDINNSIKYKVAQSTSMDASMENKDENNIFNNITHIDDVSYAEEVSQEEDYEKTYIGYYGQTKYEFITTEYALQLAEDAINNANEILADNGKKALPEFFDKYLQAGLAYQESNFRVKREDGTGLYSVVGAQGLCQIRDNLSMVDVNNWLETMGVNVEYTKEDLNDPRKSMEISVLYQALVLNNYCKNMTPEMQKYVMLMAYNIGPTKAKNMDRNEFEERYMDNEGSYANKIINFANKFRDKYPSMEASQMGN